MCYIMAAFGFKRDSGYRCKCSLIFLCGLQFQSATSGKRKLEADLQQLTQEHEELHGEVRAANDKAKKATFEVCPHCLCVCVCMLAYKAYQ